MAINKYIIAFVFLIVAALITTIIDNIVGFHISKYNLIESMALNLPRMATGFILAWIIYHL